MIFPRLKNKNRDFFYPNRRILQFFQAWLRKVATSSHSIEKNCDFSVREQRNSLFLCTWWTKFAIFCILVDEICDLFYTMKIFAIFPRFVNENRGFYALDRRNTRFFRSWSVKVRLFLVWSTKFAIFPCFMHENRDLF